MGAWVGPIGDTVPIDIEITGKALAALEHFPSHHLPSVKMISVIPLERTAQPLVHSYVQIQHHEYGRL